MDVDVIREWPYAKVQDWMLYDEVTTMLHKAKSAMPRTPFDRVIEIVIEEQTRHDFAGIYRVEDSDG
jgi:hypothetical protein